MNEFHFEILRDALAKIAYARCKRNGPVRDYKKIPREELIEVARKAFMQCGLEWIDYVP